MYCRLFITNLPIGPDALHVADLGLRTERGVADVLKSGSVLRDDRLDGLLQPQHGQQEVRRVEHRAELAVLVVDVHVVELRRSSKSD